MAIQSPADIYRGTAGVALPPVVSNDIWAITQEQSAVMQAATQIPLPGRGVQVPIITGDAVASWVGETGLKSISRPSIANKTLTGYTLAVIVPFSNQFRRDLTMLYSQIVARLPLALAKKFDQTVLGLPAGAPGSNFDTLGGATQIGMAGKSWAGLVAAQAAIATATPDGELDGWILSPQGRSVLTGATDLQNRPLFDQNIASDGFLPNILGGPVYRTRTAFAADADGAGPGTAKQYGYAGDWDQAFWGSVAGIDIQISDQATLQDADGSTINLFQQNMFAVRAEIEVGFRVRDLKYFVMMTDAVQS
jgi:HK97 family phage major capsid protein